MVTPEDFDTAILDTLAAECSEMMQAIDPGIEFGSRRHRNIIRVFFAGAQAAANGDDKLLIQGALLMMTDPDWNPDERFKF